MRLFLFKVDELAVVNREARYGLPDDVGKLVSVTEQLEHGSYDYRAKLKCSGDYIKVKESELNKVDPDDLILQINIGDTVVKPNGEEAEIVLIDYLNKQVEIMFEKDNTYEVVGIEKFIEEIR